MAIKEYTAKTAAGVLKPIRFSVKTDIHKQRIAYDEFYGDPLLSHNIDVKEVLISGRNAPDIPCNIFNPEIVFGGKAVIYLHGGCYVAGSRYAAQNICCSLCHESDARVYCPEYRLAPEHPFPAALEDAYTVYGEVLNSVGDPEKITIAGIDAGAGLGAALIMKLKENSAPLPGSVVFFSPWFDLSCSAETYAAMRKSDPVFTVERLNRSAEMYTYKSNFMNPLVSPIKGDFSRFPRTLLQTVQSEILSGDTVQFAQFAESAGVSVTVQQFPDMWHGFQSTDRLTSYALQALTAAGIFIRNQQPVEE